METILLDDFLDDGIIREKSFRQKVDKLDLDHYKDKKVIMLSKSLAEEIPRDV